MDNLQPGDKCLVIPAPPPWDHWNAKHQDVIGMTVTLVAQIPTPFSLNWSHRWTVRENDLQYAEIVLQKLPPKQETCRWDECIWQPKEVTCPAQS